MCGIVGYIGNKFVDSVLVVGLQRLEYRGYDSAGIASIADGDIDVLKRKGKIRTLDEKLKESINTSRHRMDILINLGNKNVIIVECKTKKDADICRTLSFTEGDMRRKL